MAKKRIFLSVMILLVFLTNTVLFFIAQNPSKTFIALFSISQITFLALFFFELNKFKKKKNKNVYISEKDDKNLQQLNEEDSLKFERISQAEQRLQSIINLIPNALSVKDQKGKIILANQSFASIFSKNRRDLIGLNVDELHSEQEEFQELEELDKKVLNSFKVENVNSWITQKNQQKKYFHITKIPAVDPVIDESVVLTIYNDNTDNIHHQRLLHSRSRVLTSIAENNNLKVNISRLIKDVEARFNNIKITVLQNYQESFKILASSDLNESLLNTINKMLNNNASFFQKYSSTRGLIMLNSKELMAHDTEFKKLLGNEHLESLWLKVVTDNNENKIGVIIFWRDSDFAPSSRQLKEIEECSLLVNLAITNANYQMEVQSYLEVIESSHSAIFLLNDNGKVFKSNKAAQDLIGLSSKIINNQTIHDVLKSFNEPTKIKDLLKAIENHQFWCGNIVNENAAINSKIYSISISPSDDENQLSILMIEEVSSSEELKKQIEKPEYNDPITGLYNRSMLFERLQQILDGTKRTKTTLGLILIDLDFFKKVNERVGHEEGDRVLKIIAERISKTVRKEDVIARIDGDEFAVIIRGFKSANILRTLAQKLMKEIAVPIKINGHDHFLSSSVGIGIGPNDADQASELIRNVELALYRAKINGRDQFEFYQFELNRLSQERIKLEAEMRYGISHDEFFLMFQPIVDSDSKEIVAAEALMRWKNSKRGLISPMDFIPIAEETGLINQLGEQLIKQTIDMIKSLGDSKIKIRVNLSARQITEGDIGQSIIKLLKDSDIDTSSFGVEITESLMMEKKEKALKVFNRLSDQGISIAVDDFGTGYSSLSYLKSFPIDCIKIDRLFIKEIDKDIKDKTLVDAIFAIAQKMNMSVIAEGVETFSQFETLKKMKNEKLLIQGFLFSKPLRKIEFMEQLATDHLHKKFSVS